MNMVLTLVISPENNYTLKEAHQNTCNTLQDNQISVLETQSLADDIACDIMINQECISTVNKILTPMIERFPIDWCLQSTEGRRKKALLADMDSTMITVECIDELADFAGIKSQIAEITEAAMQGKLDFKQALEERVALLKSMHEDTLDICFKERVQYSKGAKTLVQTMVKSGAYTALVSGGFTFFTEKVSEYLGFQFNRANQFEIIDQCLTGRIIPPISDASTKKECLEAICRDRQMQASQVLAIGDGANDIPMIDAAGLGVAYKAKEKARNAADAIIHHTDLATALYFQGYKQTDFVTG